MGEQATAQFCDLDHISNASEWKILGGCGQAREVRIGSDSEMTGGPRPVRFPLEADTSRCASDVGFVAKSKQRLWVANDQLWARRRQC